MRRRAANPGELSVLGPATQAVALSFVCSAVSFVVLVLLLSSKVMAASWPDGGQVITPFIPAQNHETHGPVFETWLERRDKGVVKQSLDYSCGIAALATLMEMSFDVEVTESSLLVVLKENADEWQLANDWRERGVSLAILRKLAAQYDLNAVGVSVSAIGLMQLRKPAIAFVDYRGLPHFTVLKPPLIDSRIELADPSWGNRTLTRWQFLPMFMRNGHGKLLLVDRR